MNYYKISTWKWDRTRIARLLPRFRLPFLIFVFSSLAMGHAGAQNQDLIFDTGYFNPGPHRSSDPQSFACQSTINTKLGYYCNQFASDSLSDFQNYFDGLTIPLLVTTFGIGAGVANTPLDESLRDFLHSNLVDTAIDDYAELLHENRRIGDGYIVLPAYALTALIGKGILDDPFANTVGEWSERNLRAAVVGTPALLLSQRLTGGSRPFETSHRSDWRPFQDNNGVSGHAFMGAIPFLTARKMTDNRLAKTTLLFASTLPGLSRITDDRHYPSQVMLGWTLAFVSCEAIARTELGTSSMEVAPMVVNDSMGLGIIFRR